jgi:hypothetical protein
MITSRRKFFVGTGALAALAILPSCTDAQQLTVLNKVKSISADTTEFIDRYVGAILPTQVAAIKSLNDQIQALQPGDMAGAVKTLLAGLLKAIGAVLPILMPMLPANIAETFNSVLNFLSAFAGAARASKNDAPTPQIDDAVTRAMALRLAAPDKAASK